MPSTPDTEIGAHGDDDIHADTRCLARWLGWRPVAERLRASGHRAVTLTLPGLGDGDDPSGHRLEDAIDYVVAAVERSDAHKVTLVGHSWGGYPLAGAIPRLPHRVATGIFYNALIPVPGRSWADDTRP